jgi:nitrogenase iron protein
VRIGIYGKGGIGKSTICANLAAACADTGAAVLQIGCDPKRDSTRLLLGGRRVVTVLDYLRDTPPDRQRGEDVVHVGYAGVHCVEAGGPEPGVGCAGRGILSAFALLDRLGIDWAGYDTTLFDVLGDVVCGGFAVPLRRGFAEAVLVVTSEEFMSLYAANNILRGVCNMDQGEGRAIGMVLNRRERGGEAAIVSRFADAVGVPIVAELPRSDVFRTAEASGRTVVEAFPGSDEAAILRALVAAVGDGRLTTELPRPLSDEALEDLLARASARGPLGGSGTGPGSGPGSEPAGEPGNSPADAPLGERHDAPADAPIGGRESGQTGGSESGQTGAPSGASSAPATASRRFVSKSLLAKEPLHGCAFAGAVATLTQVRDGVTVAHGPRSCTHIAASSLLSAGLGTLARHGTSVPEQLAPAVLATDLGEHAMIHGGLDELRTTLAGTRSAGGGAPGDEPRAVFVVTTCPAGVIGDDVDQAIIDERALRGASEPAPIIRVSTDGNLEGDYLQGVINAAIEGAAALIDPDRGPADDLVNIVAEKNIALNADANLVAVAGLLAGIGVRVNCRFVRRTSVAELRDFLRAPLNLPAYVDHLGRVLIDFLTERFGCAFAQLPFPSGFHETARWLREIAAFFDRLDAAEQTLDSCRTDYERAMAAVRPALSGKRLMITTYNHDVDWLLETAFDAGMEVVRVGIMDYSQDGVHRTRYADRVVAEVGYDPERRADDIRELRPDLVLANYQSPGLPDTAHYDTVPLCPDVGHLGGALLARRWARLLRAPLVEGWRRDEARLLHT